MNRASRRTSFTLIELLVVVGIIAILAALAFPAASVALASARKAKCSSNLHQIGAAMFGFAGDNNGCLPESGAVIPYNTVDSGTGKNGWCQQLEPYLGTNAGAGGPGTVFQCPDSSSVIPQNVNYSYFNGAHAAYSATGGFAAVNLTLMHDSSKHIMAGDIAFDCNFQANDADKDDYSQDPAFNGNSGTIPIHRGTVNILFADGHIESCTKFDPNAMSTVYGDNNTTYLNP